MFTISRRGILAGFLCAWAFTAAARADSIFCPGGDCQATRASFKQLCDFILEKRSNLKKIYTGSYYMRNLVAGYEIFGEQRYLDAAIAYADGLLEKQSARGYWGTGYGDIFLADTGSALGLFAVLNKHVDPARQKRYLEAVRRYLTAIDKDGLIHPSGALSGGLSTDKEGRITKPIADEYVLSTALTGGAIFTWVYHMTREDRFRAQAIRGLRWILDAMNQEGVIPYMSPFEGADLKKKDDPLNEYHLWEDLRFCTAGYVGEGIIASHRYSDQPEWRAEIEKRIRPHIRFLLDNQNPNGTWGVRMPKTISMCSGKMDMTRSPGIVNLLIWYYNRVARDPRIVTGVRRFALLFINPEEAKSYGLLQAGAGADEECSNSNTVTSLTGLAAADILSPGIASNW
jgi:hypothetical protein